jgi:transposase-like protein
MTVRFWSNRFGPMFAAEIRKKRVAVMREYPRWRWHLDEAFVKVNGKLCYLWRAVDHEGEVLESVVTAKRDKAATLRFLKRIMKKYGQPALLLSRVNERDWRRRPRVGRSPAQQLRGEFERRNARLLGRLRGLAQLSLQIGDPSPPGGDRRRWPPHTFFRSNRSTSDGRTGSTGLCARLHGA